MASYQGKMSFTKPDNCLGGVPMCDILVPSDPLGSSALGTSIAAMVRSACLRNMRRICIAEARDTFRPGICIAEARDTFRPGLCSPVPAILMRLGCRWPLGPVRDGHAGCVAKLWSRVGPPRWLGSLWCQSEGPIGLRL
jgi:hypothetical protein